LFTASGVFAIWSWSFHAAKLSKPIRRACSARSCASREMIARVSFASPRSARVHERSKSLRRVSRLVSDESCGCWVVF